MERLYRAFSIIVLLFMAYVLGLLTGYVAGYNDNYAQEVVLYRMTHKMKHRR